MARRDGARPAPHATGAAACAAAAASRLRSTRIVFTSLEALGELVQGSTLQCTPRIRVFSGCSALDRQTSDFNL